MRRQKNIRETIEKQRKKLDNLAARRKNLTELLHEAQTMDRLVEVFEEKCTIS